MFERATRLQDQAGDRWWADHVSEVVRHGRGALDGQIRVLVVFDCHGNRTVARGMHYVLCRGELRVPVLRGGRSARNTGDDGQAQYGN